MEAAATNSLPRLMVAGLIDSFGLALGWTVFTLLAIANGGLAAAGLYNAAMFVGVMLSAPVTGWLASHLPGRTLLRTTAGVEIVLRVATLAALLAGWSAPIIVAFIVAMNIVAWAGYAGMRAEVAAADSSPRAMTHYAMSIAAIEAFGAGVAALLPTSSQGTLHDALLWLVLTVYAGSLLPTFGCARRSRVPSTRTVHHHAAISQTASGPRPALGVVAHRAVAGLRAAHLRGQIAPLLAGAAIMLIASGPTRLAVALGVELHGQLSVVVSTAAFTVGCLFSSLAVGRVARLQLPAKLIWPAWGVGMLIGWVIAPWHITGLLVAQFLAGLSLTAFEGAMDAHVAGNAGTGEVTAALAWSAAARALGSAAAVRILPMLVVAAQIGQLSAVAAGTLVVGGAAAWAVTTRHRHPRYVGRHGALRVGANAYPPACDSPPVMPDPGSSDTRALEAPGLVSAGLEGP